MPDRSMSSSKQSKALHLVKALVIILVALIGGHYLMNALSVESVLVTKPIQTIAECVVAVVLIMVATICLDHFFKQRKAKLPTKNDDGN